MAQRNRVLVIDDDHDSRHNLCELLTQAGYQADHARNPEAARQRADGRQPLAVFIDGERCDPPARPSLAELRRCAPEAAIVVTAQANNPRAILRSIRAGADACLFKPFRSKDLIDTLDRLAHNPPGNGAAPPGTRLRALFEGAEFGALVLHSDACRVLTANRTTEQLLGCREGELDRQPISRFIHPDDRRAFQRLYDRLVSGGAGSLCLRSRMIDRAGQPLPTRLTLATVPDEHRGIAWIAALIEPPVDPRRTDPAAAERDALWSATHDAVIRIDLDGTITAWNPAAERTYGYTEAEILGKPLTMLASTDRHAEVPRILDQLGAADGVEPTQTTHLGRDRRPRDLRLTCRPIPDAAGQPEAALLIAHDRTRERTLERRLLESSTCEQRRIGQDLHDGLGQELTGIAFLAQCLRDQLAQEDSPHAENAGQIVTYINDAITHAKALVKGLRPAALEGRGLVHALRHLAEATARTHRIECKLDADESLQVDDTDTATHLYYIAREAVHNAIHHGQATRIQLAIETNDDCLRLSIRDNGIGLSADGPENPGSGLDIMNCRARMIGGSLHVRGAADRGTEVHCAVDLPSTPAPTSSQ